MISLGKYLADGDQGKTAVGQTPAEFAIEIKSLPRPEWCAPLPQIIANEHRVVLMYAIDHFRPADQVGLLVVTEDTPSSWAVLEFTWIYDCRFGSFSDISCERHPLASAGLQMGAVHIVENSHWKAKILGNVHPNPITLGKPRPELIHYLFTFHDSLFECIAGPPESSVLSGTAREVVRKVCTEMLFDRP